MSAARAVVRPLLDSDDLEHLAADDPFAEKYPLWRSWDSEELSAQWCVACLDDEPVGVAAVVPAGIAAGGAALALLTVRREHRRRGAGTALRAHVEGLVADRLPAVQYRILDGEPDSEAAVDAWGLERGASHAESALDLAALDRADFLRRSVVPGVEIAPLPDLDTVDEQQWSDLHAFVVARGSETPNAAGATADMPLTTFRGIVEAPWMLSTARVDGELVGVTYVYRRPDGTSANTMLTGVVPGQRGRGIASALKCSQALRLADLGFERIVTQNQEGNEPILAANRAMGFVPSLTEVEVRVDLSAGSAGTDRSAAR